MSTTDAWNAAFGELLAFSDKLALVAPDITFEYLQILNHVNNAHFDTIISEIRDAFRS